MDYNNKKNDLSFILFRNNTLYVLGNHFNYTTVKVALCYKTLKLSYIQKERIISLEYTNV